MGPPPEGHLSAAAATSRLTLRAWLQRAGRTLFDAADVFGSLMLGVRHIHRKRIVHADLKPDNIFIVVERSRVTAVRIGDFGLAGENQLFRQFDQFSSGMQHGVSTLTGGTPGYVAPEILRAEHEREGCSCSDKVDIFACAVVLLELLLPPFDTQMERIGVLHRFHGERTLPDFVNARLAKTRVLLQGMRERDPVVRFSAEEVCKRFEKEVRKELCRSSLQELCVPVMQIHPPAPIVQKACRDASQAEPGPLPKGGSGGGRRGHGRKGRRRG